MGTLDWDKAFQWLCLLVALSFFANYLEEERKQQNKISNLATKSLLQAEPSAESRPSAPGNLGMPVGVKGLQNHTQNPDFSALNSILEGRIRAGTAQHPKSWLNTSGKAQHSQEKLRWEKPWMLLLSLGLSEHRPSPCSSNLGNNPEIHGFPVNKTQKPKPSQP